MIYNNEEYKIIHKGSRINKYINRNGKIVTVDKKGNIKEYIGNPNKDGYLQTSTNLYKTQRINRLVALCFIGEPPIGKEFVDHIDGDRTNNNIENLRWVSSKENHNNPITRKRRSASKYGEKHPKALKCVIVIDGQIIKRNTQKEILETLVNDFGFSGVDKWFTKRGVPKKYAHRVSFIGTLNKYEKGETNGKGL